MADRRVHLSMRIDARPLVRGLKGMETWLAERFDPFEMAAEQARAAAADEAVPASLEVDREAVLRPLFDPRRDDLGR